MNRAAPNRETPYARQSMRLALTVSPGASSGNYSHRVERVQDQRIRSDFASATPAPIHGPASHTVFDRARFANEFRSVFRDRVRRAIRRSEREADEVFRRPRPWWDSPKQRRASGPAHAGMLVRLRFLRVLRAW